METRATLEARFGPDPALWPAPFRAGMEGSPLAQALLAEGDETALTQAVLTRLAEPVATLRPASSWLPVIVPPRVALVTYGGLCLVMAVFGYQLAGGLLGDPYLELALGALPGWEIVQ